jgi:hypothetical protein
MRQTGTIVFAPDALVYHLILTRSFSRHFRTARTFSSMIRLHRKHPGLLSKPDGHFPSIVLFQFIQLLVPMITQRREFPKNPGVYLQFCLLQCLMALDTFIRLPLYYREATQPLEIKEPFRQPSAP